MVGSTAPMVSGLDPGGGSAAVDPSSGHHVLLFMTSTCRPCREVWPLLDGLEGTAPGQLAVVTPGPESESRRQVAAHAPAWVPVVMSSQAWFDYRAGPAPWMVVVRDGLIGFEGPCPTDRSGLVIALT